MPRYIKRRGDRLYVYEQYSVRVDGKVKTPTKYIGPLAAVVEGLTAIGESIFDFLHMNLRNDQHTPLSDFDEHQNRAFDSAMRQGEESDARRKEIEEEERRAEEELNEEPSEAEDSDGEGEKGGDQNSSDGDASEGHD